MEPSDNTQNPLTWDVAAQQPSQTRKQSAQVDLSPRHTTIPIKFPSHQLFSLSGRNSSQGMVQAPATVTSGPLSSANKQSIEMAVPPKGCQIPFSVYSELQQVQPTNKFLSGMESLPGMQNQASVDAGTHFSPAPNKRSVQMVSLPKSQTTPITAGLQQLSSKRSAQTEAPVKVQAEFESVRSKLRESLAAALATVSKELNKPKASEYPSINGDKSVPLNNSTSDNLVNSCDQGQKLASDVCSLGTMSDMKEVDSKCDVPEGQIKHVNLEDDTSASHYSIIEDELLQGHGLCWESELGSENADEMLKFDAKRPKMTPVEESERRDGSSQLPENLSIKIEAELFKLFGGVNKKYKEKGRSLLFNLKDPSNPDLREGVLSGSIPPEKLCSMTAEELASKELSQWRQAKAVELAQMVVLPDTDIDIRRLVKKTHKGEFQVEVEQDDGAHVEVGYGSDVLSKMPTKGNEIAPTLSRFSEKGESLLQSEQSVSDQRDISASLDSLLPEKTDYMQDLIVDELKGTELLTPIVSLDEFMKALDTEPPFENLEVNSCQTSSAERNLDILEPENLRASDGSGEKSVSTAVASGNKLTSESSSVSKLQSANTITEDSNGTSASNADKVESKYGKSADETKADPSDIKPVLDTSKSRNMWEGLLQLNVSALSTVVSSFISGEKTSMQEWPNLLEVKGRVRLDAFEKFLLELPLSRSRAIMVVEFSWKEDSPESGRLHLTESINSYITDERLGYIEPALGVELYLCPPHPRITEIIVKHLSGDHTDNVQSIPSNLIGIVVWRRPHASISPRLSSHHKHGSSKKQHSGSRKRHSNSTPRTSVPQPHPDEEDDVPPGFGPPSFAREEDDLPEFDFSRGDGSHRRGSAASSLRPGTNRGHSQPTSVCPEEHMRELIHKYGKGKSNAGDLGIPVQPWNDDDDIPEWKPQSGPPPPPPPPPQPSELPGYHQPLPVNQYMHPQQPQMIPPNAQFFQPAPPPAITGWWPVGRGPPAIGSMPQPCNFPGQPSSGQLPGVMPGMVPGFEGLPGAWRPNDAGSRGG
ncbi:hypothetical protein AXF42_Ash013391 [Apostasia shenzhenica]|uniref:TFIIS central domain-containing protein n=1 Tax=Apostasia shenzhenica TaxID=1088818 RepID=A0A2I0A431_9ASPA|nr:hypothetical protein AXF42_Ash013391 [Apostasia shenzhenica]